MKTSRKSTCSPEQGTGVTLRSHDGAVCFRLRATPAGLWVQRDRRHAETRARLVQSVVFADRAGFVRWCEADSIRFDYPVVFQEVRRAGSALLDSHGRTPARDHSGR